MLSLRLVKRIAERCVADRFPDELVRLLEMK
jgi:hypothetical protein